MNVPEIRKENVETLLDKRFIRVYDLKYAEGKHYFDASRRPAETLAAIMPEAEFQTMLPDAVTIAVILRLPDGSDRLYLSYEYRYPAGRFLLSPPAGLLDPEDRLEKEPLLSAARREIFEETGLTVTENDRLTVVNPCLFSSPGMTDEANALVAAVINVSDLSVLTQEGAVGSECFDGYRLLSKEEAETVLKNGRDEYGHFYSVYTWCVLQFFVNGAWQ